MIVLLDAAFRLCPLCGQSYTPHRGASTCSRTCRAAASVLAYVRHVGQDDTCDPWALASPAVLALATWGSALPLHLADQHDRSAYRPKRCRLWHGVVTALLREPHRETPPWLSWPGEGCWWVWTRDVRAVALLAERTVLVPVGKRQRWVTVGAVRACRLPPARSARRYHVAIETKTPVLIREGDTGQTSGVPLPRGISSTLACTLAPRLGLPLLECETVPIEQLRYDTRPARLHVDPTGRLGGNGIFRGWEGSVTYVTSALGAWLAECAALLGLGGRTAYGMGRVRVEVT